ncbi:hypothetical protein L2E82_31111 [Cichorium intybus]|uniref:Uncharacterized protein n=1 Tax=Cichorium intybus TaxID=13427 RepID=A0ACB9D2A5_CICIN|nr:hypothetical protein L2E82_31111 [Cichorium intybus]
MSIFDHVIGGLEISVFQLRRNGNHGLFMIRSQDIQMTYALSEYTLKYVTIKGAGHGVALYKPEEALSMVNGWLSSQTYLSDS